MKSIAWLVVGLFLGTFISTAVAKFESGSVDAQSVVGYGKYGSTIVKIKVDADGKLQTK